MVTKEVNLSHKQNFLIPLAIYLQPDGVNFIYFKLRLNLDIEIKKLWQKLISLSILLHCKCNPILANFREIFCLNWFIFKNNKSLQSTKLAEVWLKDGPTRKKSRTRNIEISKYFHLISYKYSKINCKKLKMFTLFSEEYFSISSLSLFNIEKQRYRPHRYSDKGFNYRCIF